MHLTHINSIHLHVLNKFLMSKGRHTIEDRFVAIALTRMSVNGLVIHGRITSKVKGNSYTIEFTYSSTDICFGYAEMFICYQNEIYVLIRRIQRLDWPVCESCGDHLSDIVAIYGDLQELLREHVIMVEETDQFVAIELPDIATRVFCVKMDSHLQCMCVDFPTQLNLTDITSMCLRIFLTG